METLLFCKMNKMICPIESGLNVYVQPVHHCCCKCSNIWKSKVIHLFPETNPFIRWVIFFFNDYPRKWIVLMSILTKFCFRSLSQRFVRIKRNGIQWNGRENWEYYSKCPYEREKYSKNLKLIHRLHIPISNHSDHFGYFRNQTVRYYS